MGIRTIRLEDDPILLKKSREVTEINERILELIDDMVDTMNEAQGIGLAAPQVGVLRRIFVASVEEGVVYKVINPEFLEMDGSEIDAEGCLSIPNFRGTVERATKVKMKYTTVEGKEEIIEAEGLLARCFQHEYDHLEGILITSKYIDEVTDSDDEE